MSVPAENWEVGVGQCSTDAVEGVPVPVLPVLEPHVDVDGAGAPLLEPQLGHVGPDGQGAVDLCVHVNPEKIMT